MSNKTVTSFIIGLFCNLILYNEMFFYNGLLTKWHYNIYMKDIYYRYEEYQFNVTLFSKISKYFFINYDINILKKI